jgi:hypothetical protein
MNLAQKKSQSQANYKLFVKTLKHRGFEHWLCDRLQKKFGHAQINTFSLKLVFFVVCDDDNWRVSSVIGVFPISQASYKLKQVQFLHGIISDKRINPDASVDNPFQGFVRIIHFLNTKVGSSQQLLLHFELVEIIVDYQNKP